MVLGTIGRVGADGDCEMRRAWYLASELLKRPASQRLLD